MIHFTAIDHPQAVNHDEIMADANCEACGTKLAANDEGGWFLQCPKCRHLNRLWEDDLPVLHPLVRANLGRGIGKMQWCPTCAAITPNAPGLTYSGKPFDDERNYHLHSEGDLPALMAQFYGCGVCGYEKFWLGGWACPACRSDVFDVVADYEDYHSVLSFDCMSAHSWVTTHLCTACGTIYSFTNGDC